MDINFNTKIFSLKIQGQVKEKNIITAYVRSNSEVNCNF